MQRKAVVLLSGGLDSATAMAIADSEHFEIYALSFDYGQRHAVELDSARKIAAQFSAREHAIVKLDLRAFGGSALTSDIAVPKDRNTVEIGQGIPATYVPARNTIFLSLALAYAEVKNSTDIFIGVNALDYSGYPDCRPEFIEAFERMANLATKAAVEQRIPLNIHTPLIGWTKAQIIRAGANLGVDFATTISCYDPTPDGKSCGRCDSCILRKKGFAEAKVPDTTRYA